MKQQNLVLLRIFVLLIFVFTSGCKKEITNVPPTLTTTVVSNVMTNSFSTGGNISSDGGAQVLRRGVCWGTSANPSPVVFKTEDGTGTGIFTSSVTGLLPGTTYYVKAYAANSEGFAFGEEISVSTITIPTISTTAVSAITSSTATSGGEITKDGGAAITARGVCWTTTLNLKTANGKTVDGSGTGSFTSQVAGLASGKAYYLRAYATNSAGTGYGAQFTFLSQGLVSETFTDIDGNVYHAVVIGTQTWMVENLKTTKYRNGDPIPNVTVDATWTSLTTGAYCWYNNNVSYKAIYGALYNWYAVSDSRNIAPTGWHVATDAEWTTLTTFLGGESVAGMKLKETGTSHWVSPNAGATNSSGFSALPGGLRYFDGYFDLVRNDGIWWSSTEKSATNARLRIMYDIISSVGSYDDSKYFGFSVRCLRD